jgi:hypothetical protein
MVVRSVPTHKMWASPPHGNSGIWARRAQLLMTMVAHIKPRARRAAAPITTVITLCSHRKTARVCAAATPVSLSPSPQQIVQSAWLEKIQALPAETLARALYGGRGFALALEAAALAKAHLYIVSAGLGLVAADQKVPSYGLTVSDGHAESIAARVTGEFDSADWFSGLLSNSYSTQWADAVGASSGRILVALTRPYAKMVGRSLAAVDASALARLRIFGVALTSALPTALHPAIAPYDERLDAILPGTRADFSQRALLHFVRSIAVGHDVDRIADFAAVEAALAGAAPPKRTSRPRRSDDEILERILVRLRSESGIARILRALRDEEGVACEQARFSRLYRTALEQRAAI